MGRHHRIQGQLPVGADVFLQGFETALIHGNGKVGIRLDPAVAGKMLAAAAHAGGPEAFYQGSGQGDHRFRAAMEGAAADHAGAAVVQVQVRGEGKIHSPGPQFGSQHVAHLPGQAEGARGIGIPGLAQAGHGRQAGEALPEALHPSAFMIHGDQQRWLAQGMDFRGQGEELFRVRVVAGKQDDAAHQGVAQAFPVQVGERGALDVYHQGAKGLFGHGRSRIT